MASRVTNSMITDNAAYNIQLNKRYKDNLSKQQATERKIYDPSDDPVIAVRDLKYTAALADLDQYLNRNLADATSWVDMTFTALNSARDVAEKMKKEYTSGINGTNTVSDRQIYLENMKALAEEYYKIGNSASEDRYLFTGYRTGDSLTFTDHDMNVRANTNGQGNPKFDYIIRETFDKDDIDLYSYLNKKVESSDITDPAASTLDETQVENVACYRLMLSYDDLKETQTSTHDYEDKAGNQQTLECGYLTYTNSAGDKIRVQVQVVNDDTNDTLDPANAGLPDLNTSGASAGRVDGVDVNGDPLGTVPNEDGVIYLNAATGMLIFGDAWKVELQNSTGISFDYQKDEWDVGDLKPEHYFDCVEVALTEGNSSSLPTSIEHVFNDHEQKMNYAVGESQVINVNINACEAFDPHVKRQLDELEDAINALNNADAKVEELKGKLNSGIDNVDYLYNAAKKEQECCLARLNKVLEEDGKKANENYNTVNLAATKCGTVQNRITLVSNRLTENVTTVTAQASDNINIDLADIIIKLNEAAITYSGSLGVIGKITQQTLLNYI